MTYMKRQPRDVGAVSGDLEIVVIHIRNRLCSWVVIGVPWEFRDWDTAFRDLFSALPLAYSERQCVLAWFLNNHHGLLVAFRNEFGFDLRARFAEEVEKL